MSSKTILCDLGLESRADYKKWALRNHPDKGGDTEVFKNVSMAANAVLPDSESRLKCSTKPQHSPPRTEKMVVSPKKAQCTRNIENWSKIQRHQRFDKPQFDPVLMREEIPIQSPKISALIRNIRELDTVDMETEGRRYKHFIFSDIKSGGHGAKIVTSALIAHGFTHCFDIHGKIRTPPPHSKHETLGVLSSTSVFERTFTKQMKQNVLALFNARPHNIHGQQMRFIVLDSGFKEGIDLFDVKYVHIFEQQRNPADFVQAVGRATRSCGQRGLDFVANRGWELRVYTYNLEDETGGVLFDDYLKYAGVDLNKRAFTPALENLAMLTAVDYGLTREIHNYRASSATSEGAIVTLGGGPADSIGCAAKSKCGQRSTKDVPFSLPLMIEAYKAANPLPKAFKRLLTKNKRRFLCEKLKRDPAFCKRVNQMYKTSKKQKTSTVPTDLVDMASDVKQLISKEKALIPKTGEGSPEDPERMSFEEHREYINRMFSEYAYPKLVIKNECESGETDTDERIVQFTETQEFVTRYFVPEAYMKGMLIWHSVGTGKTCTAISVKSFMYEKHDYWIIWVTRNTLREDIWKNMYHKICDHTLRKLAKEGKDTKALKKAMYKRFLPPMSYRQFSNLIEGKNEFSRRLIEANGRTTLLNNCLVIMDEAHKLYGKDLIGAERPNMRAIEGAVASAPTCKLLLMTGTPIADDPMEFIQLMNLILPTHQAFPTDYGEFHRTYLNNNAFTEDGRRRFQEKSKGLISYLNRRFDPRRFAQPVFRTITSRISVQKEDGLRECLSKIERNCGEVDLEGLKKEVEESERMYASHQTKIRETESSLSNAIPRSQESKDIRSTLKSLKSENKDLRKVIRTKQNAYRNATKTTEACKRGVNRSVKACEKSHKEQGALYQKQALETCYKA
jgi:hypothetical protein